MLDRAESLFGTFEDNLPNGAIFQLFRGADGRMAFTAMSAGIVELAGIEAHSVVENAESLLSRIWDEDRERLLMALNGSAERLQLVDVEVRLIGLDGEVRWAQLRCRPRMLLDGGMAWDGLLFDTTDRKRSELLLVAENRLSVLLSEMPAEDVLWKRLVDVVGEALGWEAGECWRLDGDALKRVHAWCRPRPESLRFVALSEEWRFPTGEGLPGMAWKQGCPVWMPDLAGEPFFRRKDLARESDLGCGVGIPVRIDGECVAVVALFSRPRGQDFPAMRRFAEGLARTLSRYLEHQRAEEVLREAKEAAERANRHKDVFAGRGVTVRERKRYCR